MLRIITNGYFMLIGVLFFDFLNISVAEIAFSDFHKLKNANSKFLLSLLLSMLIYFLLIAEFVTAWTSISIHRIKTEKEDKVDSLEKSKKKEMKNEAPRVKMLVEKYTEGLTIVNQDPRNVKYLMLISNIRFFMMQLVIVALQHLNRTQSVIVFFLNLSYFVYFIWLLQVANVFESNIYMIKEVIQEGCIMVFIGTITLFSFTEKSKFSSSDIYKLIEWVAIFSILGACGAEFVIFISEIGSEMLEAGKSLSKKCRRPKIGEVESLELGKGLDDVRGKRRKLGSPKNKNRTKNIDESGWGPTLSDLYRRNEEKVEQDLRLPIKRNARKSRSRGEWLDSEGLEDSQGRKIMVDHKRRNREIDITLKESKKNRKILAFQMLKKK